MEPQPDFDPRLSEEALQNNSDEPTALFAQSICLSLDPILDDCDSKPSPNEQSRNDSEIVCFKAPTSGKRHSILGTGNRSAFRKPNLNELRERYQNAKERVKEWNIGKMWASRAERAANRNALASLSDIVTAAFWIREGIPRTSCEVC